MSDYALPVVMPRLKSEALERIKYENLLKTLINRRSGAADLDTVPLDVTIDLSTACHLKCPYCATGSGILGRRPMVLGVDDNQRILNFCGKESFVARYFSNGEPLLNKRLAEIVAEAKRHEIFTVISTSLSVPLTDARIDQILLSGLDLISCSIDGANAETYSKYRIGGNFDLVMGNLERLVSRKRALGLEFPLLEWRCLVFQHNQDEQEATGKLALEMGVDIVEFFPGATPDQPAEGAVRPMTGNLIKPSVFGPAIDAGLERKDTVLRRHCDVHYVNTGEPDPSLQNKKCDWLYFGAMFYPDGGVGSCCLFGHPTTDFGQIDVNLSYQDVWNNANYQDARACFRPDSPASASLCARCPSKVVQDRFFSQSLRGLLLNAPEWFLDALLTIPDQIFYPVDMYFLTDELMALRKYGQMKATAQQ